METYPKGGAREANVLKMTGRDHGAEERGEVQVGPWEGSLWSLTSTPRPVNAVVLFVTIDGMVVEAVANAGTSGVPGDDWNPLIDEDLLIEVVAEHLRPYPE